MQTKIDDQSDEILQDSALGQWYGMNERIAMATRGERWMGGDNTQDNMG